MPAPHAPDLWLWGAQRPFPLITRSSKAKPGKHLMRVMVARWATSSLAFCQGFWRKERLLETLFFFCVLRSNLNLHLLL
jgi:hypothetical protein